MGAKMQDQQNDQKDKSEDRAPAPANIPPKPCREVVVTHLDAPPPSEKRSIHPRRPAPPVPTHEERTGEQSAKDTDSENPSSD